ncbi:MAG: DEAD/DEAH box helicase, partial [Clostridia bacterium]
MKFNEMNLNEKIVIALDAQSITEPTEIQANCIPLIMAGNDVIGRSQTGSGKTFAFGIPAIVFIDSEERGVHVLVLYPTRELSVQTTEEMRKLTNQIEGCKVVPIYGGASLERQIMALKKGARIVVGTPGRIIDHINRKTLKLNKIKLVVLDEADEMLNMGFREDMEDILKFTPAERQTVMFSATMPKPILEITKNYMKNPQLIEVGVDNRPIETISQKFLYVAKQYKREALLHLFYTLKPKISLIFCNTKRMVDDLSKFMYANGFKVEGLHGDMRQGERKRVMDKMRSQEIDVLIATDVAARGIDINDIETVFNYDIPQNIDYYIHRIGRTGRAGKSGQAYTIISDKYQFSDLDDIQTTTKIKIEEYICEYSVGIKRTAKPKKLSVDMPEDTQPKEENAKAEQISSKPNADRRDEILEFNKAMTDFDSRTRPRGRGAFGRKPTGARQSAGGRSDNRSSDRRTSASSDRSSDRKPSGSSNYRGNREDKPAFGSDRPKFNREKPAYNREDKPAYSAEKREYKPRLNEDGSPAERTFKPREERSYDRKPSDSARSYDRKPSGSSNYRGNREDKP